MTEIDRFRGIEKVAMVTVCEGEGTSESPSRLVNYFYDENFQFVCKHDPLASEIKAPVLPPPSEVIAPAPEPKSKTSGRERIRELNAKRAAKNPDADDGTNDLIEIKINEGMKPRQIAEDLGVSVQKVYNQKTVMKKEGRLHVPKWPKATIEKVLALVADHKDSVAIAIQLGLETEEVKEIIKQTYSNKTHGN